MELYFLINMPINVSNLWFLPFEQYPLVRQEMAPMVKHRTRGGYQITSTRKLHLHYVVLRNETEVYLPQEAGAITDFLIPQEWVQREKYFHSLGDDKIRDYIKAAADYLNIEIRYRPEAAGWYRKLLGGDKIKEHENVGGKTPRETRQHEAE